MGNRGDLVGIVIDPLDRKIDDGHLPRAWWCEGAWFHFEGIEKCLHDAWYCKRRSANGSLAPSSGIGIPPKSRVSSGCRQFIAPPPRGMADPPERRSKNVDAGRTAGQSRRAMWYIQRRSNAVSKANPYQRADHFTKKAKAAGFPARSVYKLEEIDKRTRMLRKGQHVLDLGSCPGSWSRYVCEKIGDTGRLLSMDLNPLEIVLPPNAKFIQGDALSLENEVLGEYGPYDVVLSDMAPSTTGNRFTDQTRSAELAEKALEVAIHFGKPGSHFVAKIFMGEDFPKIRERIRKLYTTERLIRPEGTRLVSYEIFMIGMGRRA